MGDTSEVWKSFRALTESADRKFVRVRDIPLHSRIPHHYFHKVFKSYTKLWKYQQENRLKLLESGLQRWEIGEIASRIGQLYYGQYMRSSETRFLLEAYVFYEAVLSRAYFETPKGVPKDLRLRLRFKEFRFYARFLVVSLLLNRPDTVRVLADRFRILVDDTKAHFPDTNLREWKQVVQEIFRFLKVDTAFMHTRPLRYCTILDSHPASLPCVARFHAKKVLKLRETLLASYHRNEVRFMELTLDTFRMLQFLEWEPSGSFFQARTTEPINNGGLNYQSGASGLIDINLAMDMTDPTLPPNPRKAILYRPCATHLISVIATICEELPPDSICLIYLSASGTASRDVTTPAETSGTSRNLSNSKVSSRTYHKHDISHSGVPIEKKRDSNDCHGDSLWFGPKGSGGSNYLYPGDIIPFTRRPLFFIIDSDNSHAFKVIHGAERGETAALLLSPQRPAFRIHPAADPTHTGSQFTFFLTSPLQAFCQLVGLSPSDITDKDILDKAESILSSAFSEWEIKLCTLSGLDLVWAQVMSDPFLRRLILRFIFCRSVLSHFCLSEDQSQYLPVCLPPLPEYVSSTSGVVQYNVQSLAKSLGVTECFQFDASLHLKREMRK